MRCRVIDPPPTLEYFRQGWSKSHATQVRVHAATRIGSLANYPPRGTAGAFC